MLNPYYVYCGTCKYGYAVGIIDGPLCPNCGGLFTSVMGPYKDISSIAPNLGVKVNDEREANEADDSGKEQ